MITSRRKTHKLNRTSQFLEPYDVILIVCEGSATEPSYFNKMIERERLSSANVCVTGECSSDPLSVVNYAIDKFELRNKDQNNERKYDRIYCLIDRDEHANLNSALDKAFQYNKNVGSQIITLIKSYPCFEYWYICNFDLFRGSIKRIGNKSPGAVCESYLNRYWKQEFKKNYNKTDPNNYTLLENKIYDGLKNAKSSLKDAKAVNEENPSTEVHILIEYLLNLKRK